MAWTASNWGNLGLLVVVLVAAFLLASCWGWWDPLGLEGYTSMLVGTPRKLNHAPVFNQTVAYSEPRRASTGGSPRPAPSAKKYARVN